MGIIIQRMNIILGTIVGLGIFLFGMHQLEQGLQSLGNNRIKKILSRSTEKPIFSVASGVTITAIVQSSSMVSLMVLAFASAGMIPLFNAVGVILGANLGTTFSGWIVTTIGFKMDLAAIALPLFGLSSIVYLFSERRPVWRSGAQAVIGLGLLIFGLSEMKDAVETLPLLFDLSSLVNMPIVVYLLVGMLMTALIQSSSAMTLITLTALHSGIVDLPAAAALVVGADIGTTSTTILGSLRGSRIMKQLALAHVVYNLVVDILAFLVLLPLLPSAMEFVGITDPLYGIVMFQSSFNLIGLFLFVPFLKQFSDWLSKRFGKDEDEYISLYLHNTSTEVTDAGLITLEKEVRHLLEMGMTLNMQAFHFSPLQIGTPEQVQSLQKVAKKYEGFNEGYVRLKRLETLIRHYSIRLESVSLNVKQIERISLLLECARDNVFALKSLKDIQLDLDLFRQGDSESSLLFNQEISNSQEEILRCQLSFLQSDMLDEQRLNQFHLLNDMISQQHQALNEDIAESLRLLPADKNKELDVSAAQVTTMLNVSREILHANQGVQHALKLYFKVTEKVGVNAKA